MLTCKVGNKTISSLNKKNKDKLRKWSDKGILKCPICSKQMIFKSGELVTWHFAHKSKCDFDDIYSEPETEEHMKGKKYLYIWFKRQPNIKKVELEKWIPEIKLRPDLFIVDDNNEKYCLEFQCSPITLDKKKSKTELYETMGYRTIWIFGVERIGRNSKVADEYRLDVENKVFMKESAKQSLKDKDNLYFEYGEIFTNHDVFRYWLFLLNKYKSDHSNYMDSIRSRQYEVYIDALIDLFDNKEHIADFSDLTVTEYYSLKTEYIQFKELMRRKVD